MCVNAWSLPSVESGGIKRWSLAGENRPLEGRFWGLWSGLTCGFLVYQDITSTSQMPPITTRQREPQAPHFPTTVDCVPSHHESKQVLLLSCFSWVHYQATRECNKNGATLSISLNAEQCAVTEKQTVAESFQADVESWQKWGPLVAQRQAQKCLSRAVWEGWKIENSSHVHQPQTINKVGWVIK